VDEVSGLRFSARESAGLGSEAAPEREQILAADDALLRSAKQTGVLVVEPARDLSSYVVAGDGRARLRNVPQLSSQSRSARALQSHRIASDGLVERVEALVRLIEHLVGQAGLDLRAGSGDALHDD